MVTYGDRVFIEKESFKKDPAISLLNSDKEVLALIDIDQSGVSVTSRAGVEIETKHFQLSKCSEEKSNWYDDLNNLEILAKHLFETKNMNLTEFRQVLESPQDWTGEYETAILAGTDIHETEKSALESTSEGFRTHSSIGGYSLAYVGDGSVYCGGCAKDAVNCQYDPQTLVPSVIWKETDPINCDNCEAEVSN
ncbi:hypothetical protein CL622_00350 [archaeon]|nr:hypothetical protein [archaeon]|tara:strand:- start:266 stop:847 length:582 start_codon:yes stop_codon:yes gene_type:complete